MKELKIEWKHYDKAGETCTRCNNTGDNLKEAIAEIQKKYKSVKINYLETILSAKDMHISNSILINNKLIEDILGVKSSESYCHSCSCLNGNDTNCRTIEASGNTYEEIPKEFITLALKKVIKQT